MILENRIDTPALSFLAGAAADFKLFTNIDHHSQAPTQLNHQKVLELNSLFLVLYGNSNCCKRHKLTPQHHGIEKNQA